MKTIFRYKTNKYLKLVLFGPLGIAIDHSIKILAEKQWF